jgi:hypothetical protein
MPACEVALRLAHPFSFPNQSLMPPLLRDAAREMFNFPAPELPRLKQQRRGLSAEEQEQARRGKPRAREARASVSSAQIHAKTASTS